MECATAHGNRILPCLLSEKLSTRGTITTDTCLKLGDSSSSAFHSNLPGDNELIHEFSHAISSCRRAVGTEPSPNNFWPCYGLRLVCIRPSLPHLLELRYMTSVPAYSWHDDVIKWKHFPRYWPFVRGIHRSPVNSPHKGQWRGALMFTLICARINDWVNNGEAGDLRRNRAHYDVIVMGRIGCRECT